MLKGIDNRLNAEVLGTLRGMGHGDCIIVVDTNFPAESVARATLTGKLLRMENLTAAEALRKPCISCAGAFINSNVDSVRTSRHFPAAKRFGETRSEREKITETARLFFGSMFCTPE